MKTPFYKKTGFYMIAGMALIILVIAALVFRQQSKEDAEMDWMKAQVFASMDELVDAMTDENVAQDDILFEGSVSHDGYTVGLLRDQKSEYIQFFTAEELPDGYRLYTASRPQGDKPDKQPMRGVYSFETPQYVFSFHHIIGDSEDTAKEYPEMGDFQDMTTLADGRILHYRIETTPLED